MPNFFQYKFVMDMCHVITYAYKTKTVMCSYRVKEVLLNIADEQYSAEY